MVLLIGLVLFIPNSPPQRPDRNGDGEFTMFQGGTYDLTIDGVAHRCVAGKRSTTCRPFRSGEWR
jgi:hypothetical protein